MVITAISMGKKHVEESRKNVPHALEMWVDETHESSLE